MCYHVEFMYECMDNSTQMCDFLRMCYKGMFGII